MNEVLTAAITVVLGFVVFVLGQIAQRFFIEPIQEQKRLIGEIAHALLFYANVVAEFIPPDIVTGGREMKIGAEREEVAETRKALRGLAGRLQESLWTVPFYDALARVGWVRSKEDVIEASVQLVGWSNSLSRDDSYRDKRLKIIADRLGITEKLEPSGAPRTE